MNELDVTKLGTIPSGPGSNVDVPVERILEVPDDGLGQPPAVLEDHLLAALHLHLRGVEGHRHEERGGRRGDTRRRAMAAADVVAGQPDNLYQVYWPARGIIYRFQAPGPSLEPESVDWVTI